MVKMQNEKVYLKEVTRLLKRKYKEEMMTSLHHLNPWELLVATMLSAQSQDKQVNKITVNLFKKYKNMDSFSKLKPQQLYPYIGSLGLYRNKAKSIVKTAKLIKSNFNGQVPRTIEELTTLEGVGRKTANVVLANAFGINEGIAIDTHCITVVNRLGLVRTKDPRKIEGKLMGISERREWGNLTHLFISLGRDTCTARVKYCHRCVLKNICPSSDARD